MLQLQFVDDKVRLVHLIIIIIVTTLIIFSHQTSYGLQ